MTDSPEVMAPNAVTTSELAMVSDELDEWEAFVNKLNKKQQIQQIAILSLAVGVGAIAFLTRMQMKAIGNIVQALNGIIGNAPTEVPPSTVPTRPIVDLDETPMGDGPIAAPFEGPQSEASETTREALTGMGDLGGVIQEPPIAPY